MEENAAPDRLKWWFMSELVLAAKDRAMEQALIEACKQGDHDAFAALFEAHKDRVYSIALRFAGDRAAAMDIAQETFLKLLSAIQDFRGDASFDSWVYRLVANACLDQRRRARRWIPAVEDLLGALRASGETVLQRLVRAETEESVQKVVAALPPEQRIVVILRYTEGLSYDAIGEILDCPPGTVASRLNRAHKALERRLAPLRGENRG